MDGAASADEDTGPGDRSREQSEAQSEMTSPYCWPGIRASKPEARHHYPTSSRTETPGPSPELLKQMVALLIIPGDGIFNELSINHTHPAPKGPTVWERLFRKHTDEQKQNTSAACPPEACGSDQSWKWH